MFVYIDESGDLGFSEKSTKHFVIALVGVENPKEIKNTIKKIRQRIIKKKLKEVPELKFNKSSHLIKERFLRALCERNIEICVIILKKEQVYGYLHEHRNEIYNYVTKFLVEKLLINPEEREIHLKVDKFLSKSNRENYNLYVKSQIENMCHGQTKITIEHVDSQEEPCIQAADFVAGAVFRKHEFGDDTYYKLIERKITSIQELFRK